MLFERIGADGADNWRFCAAAARDFQRRFRQAICRIERFPAKAALTKLVCKAPQCFKAHRLGAVISYAPTAQIESCALLCVYAAQAQVVSEVWAACMRDLKARDGFQPAQWLLKKRGRRHDDDRESSIERLDNAVDQTHVMKMWKPCERATVGRMRKALVNGGRIVQNVAVRDHHTLRRGC